MALAIIGVLGAGLSRFNVAKGFGATSAGCKDEASRAVEGLLLG